MDKKVPLPERDFKSPFLLPIEKVVAVPGRGQVIVGTAFRGILKKGDPLEIVGFDKTLKSSASEIHVFNNPVNECKAGDNVGILARSIKTGLIERGMMAVVPNSVQQTNAFEASVYVLKKSEGGRTKPMFPNYYQPLYTKTITLDAQIHELKDGKEMLMPGDYANVNFLLKKPIVIMQGDRFSIRECNNLTSMTGVVSKVLPFNNKQVVGFNVPLVRKKFVTKTPNTAKPASDKKAK